MPKFPRAREVEKVLKNSGFYFARQSGSHMIYKNSEGVMITLPKHGGKSISPGVFLAILKDLKMNKKDFWNAL